MAIPQNVLNFFKYTVRNHVNHNNYPKNLLIIVIENIIANIVPS